MPNQTRKDDEQRRAAARSADSLLNARNSARRESSDARRTRDAQPDARRRRPAQPPAQQTSMIEFIKQNSTFILPVVAVVAIVVLMILFIRGCAPEPEQAADGSLDSEAASSATSAEAYVSPFDWNNLVREGDRYSYVVDGEVKSKLGIDVSDHQQEIDWNAVAGDGIDFAVIRLGYRGSTEGEIYLDEQYWANVSGATEAGMPFGVYFFSQARTVEEAKEEADFVVENLSGLQLAYPVAFDSEHVTLDETESRISGLSQEEMTAIADAFCERVEAAGYKTVIYAANYDLARYVHEDIAAEHTLWWAEYSEGGPSAPMDIAIWQYANTGAVAGIETNVDMNLDLSGVL